MGRTDGHIISRRRESGGEHTLATASLPSMMLPPAARRPFGNRKFHAGGILTVWLGCYQSTSGSHAISRGRGALHTGIWKDPVRGRCRVGRLNLQGDGQGDLAGHGGEHRAVFVYQIESYRYWQEQLKEPFRRRTVWRTSCFVSRNPYLARSAGCGYPHLSSHTFLF